MAEDCTPASRNLWHTWVTCGKHGLGQQDLSNSVTGAAQASEQSSQTTIHGEFASKRDASLPTNGGGRWTPLFVLPLVALAVVWVYIDVGVPHTFDTSFHWTRIGALDRHLRDGLFFPRWLPEMLLGYGYPLLNYYAPSIYYVGEFWHFFGASVYQSIILTAMTSVLVAGFGAYFLAYDLLRGRRSAALVSAAMYMLSPYLMINIFNRGAIGETGAQALFPWALWCAGRIFTARRPAAYAVPMVIVLALLASMHTITLFYAPAIVFFYLVCGFISARRSDAAAARRGLAWAAGAILGGMALSAFFWMPLLFERAYVSDRGFQIARDVMLQSGIWSWHNFLDLHLVYENVSQRPVQLGLVQLTLATAGLIVGFWKGMSSEWRWWFWIAITATFVLLLTRASLALWENTLLAATQFPWRVLSMLSLPLALFAGATLLAVEKFWLRVALSGALIVLIIYAQTPRISNNSPYAAETDRSDAATLAMLDLDKGTLQGGEYNSSIQEFRPIWASDEIHADARQDDEVGSSTDAPEVTALSSNLTKRTFQVHVPGSGSAPLVLLDFYFPGWAATLNGEVALTPYPSEGLGLLTVDLPPGDHLVQVEWRGTPLERAASLISLAAALLFGVGLLFAPRMRLWSLPFLTVFVVGLWGRIWESAETPLVPPSASYEENGLRLLGASVSTEDERWPTLSVYWQVTGAPPETMVTHVQVQDAAGSIVGSAAMRPWYNTSSPHVWPRGAVVDDWYQLPLPNALPAGEYRLAIETLPVEALPAHDQTTALETQFSFTLPGSLPPDPIPDVALAADAADSIQLAGYSILRPTATTKDGLAAVVNAGDLLRLSLFWRPQQTVYNQNHGFVHLADIDGQVHAQRDQGTGPLSLSPEIWLPERTYEDVYQMLVPSDTPSGVYTPIVGQYVFAPEDRLPVWLPEVEPAGEPTRLSPVKVLNSPRRAEGEEVNARLGEFAELATWSGIQAEAGTHAIAPGETYTVTLVWRSVEPTNANYTRFLQVVDASNRIVAQHDGIPQHAFNPTWSWIPDELIVDGAPLTIAADAAPGEYRLLAGLYDTDTGARVLATDDSGAPHDSNAVLLATLEVLP